VGSYELTRIEKNLVHRQEVVSLYDRLLRDAGWPTPPVPEDCTAAMVRYPVRVANKEQFLKLATKHCLEVGDWFECPLHGAEISLDKFAFDPAACPESARASQQVVNLPTHLRVSLKTAQRVAAFLIEHGRKLES